MRVLLVEDDELLGDGLIETVRGLGYRFALPRPS